MDDSDEYFDDSIVLDEAALASIQATEERFGASLSQVHSHPPSPSFQQPPPPLRSAQGIPSSPPAKKLKTSHREAGVSSATIRAPPQPALRRTESTDLIPEIRVGPDGNYIINAQSKATNRAEKSRGEGTAFGGGVVRPPTTALSSISGDKHSATKDTVPSLPRATVIPRHERTGQGTSSAAQPLVQRSNTRESQQNVAPAQSQSLRSHVPVPPQRPGLVRRTTTSVAQNSDDRLSASQRRTRLIEQAMAEASVQSQLPSPTPAAPIVLPDTVDIQAELASLRAQLAEMNAANEAIQQSLREAQDAQLVKAGEVSFLRQTIDKTRKEHSEAVAKAKADMIAYEKTKAEMQAKLKEETERMATRLVFKQHEIETSVRKPTWGSASVRSRRIMRDSLQPVETPTRAREALPPPSTSRTVGQVPPQQVQHKHGSQARIRDNDEGPMSSPTSAHIMRADGEMKQPRFKGFHNAFTDSGPVFPRIHTRPKEKEANIEEHPGSDPFFMPHENKDVIMQDPADDKGKGKEVDAGFGHDEDDGDAHTLETRNLGQCDMANKDEGQVPFLDSGSGMEEGVAANEDIDWGEELRRIVFTHIAPRNDVLTIHILLSHILPQELAIQEKHAYAAACQVILEKCGATHGYTECLDNSEWEADVLDKVASAFVTLGDILGRAGCILPLVALLDLLVLLVLYIPAFSSPLLGPAAANNILGRELNLDGPSQLLSVLCDIVRDHLTPPKLNGVPAAEGISEETRTTLAVSVVHLMESLCWNVKDGFIEQLALIPHRPQVLEILLDPFQPPKLTICTLQLLILLATGRNMFRSLLAFLNMDTVSERDESTFKGGDLQIPLVEKLCYFLIQPMAEESYPICRLIITLVGLLFDSHADARMLLLNTASLIPSLVICTTKLSKQFWEDDLAIIRSPPLAKLVIDILYLSVSVLHHMVFTPDLSSLLGRKLIEATRLSGPFNGVTHMFIVTFGRLSWAEGPDWLDDECKCTCEMIAEIAMEIIEIVVAGPECDSLWAVWHQPGIDDDDDNDTESDKIKID
ncbi:hypothetical protein K439DRAFT_1661015 [Ramaria rubella]|nr:hypothetical protein K439DRAFT_1661015 [Ramaria rubella]